MRPRGGLLITSGVIMRKWIWAGIAAALTGCSVSDYMPGAQIVAIDGRDFVVSRNAQNPDLYTASPDKPTAEDALGPGWASLAAPNLRAIEAASGCRAVPASVRTTQAGVTVAAVSC